MGMERQKKKKNVKINDVQFVQGEKRRILIGRDEDHLFICILPELVDTVEEAHECLKPDEIRYSKKIKYTRQGEWFFIETNDSYPNSVIKKREGMSNGKGRPHKVSEMVDFEDDSDEEEKKEFIIRGYVSHPEHENKYFTKWMRAIPNTEKPLVRTDPKTKKALPEIKGVTWID